MKQNKIIAITGGIGSGKSEILRSIKDLGGKTASADEINRELLTDADYLDGLKKLFPMAFVNEKLDKQKLRNQVFSNDEKLELLNSYSSSEIWKRIKNIIASADSNTFIEIPLLAESDKTELFDEIWVVISTEAVSRAAKRDGATVEDIEKIAKKQATNEKRKSIATKVIYNNGSLQELQDKIRELFFSL